MDIAMVMELVRGREIANAMPDMQVNFVIVAI
jgi:hypothetical protein